MRAKCHVGFRILNVLKNFPFFIKEKQMDFRTRHEFIQSSLNDFLSRANYNNIYQFHDAQTLANRSSQRLFGKDLVKLNVRREAHRLQIRSQRLINLATDYIWNLHSTSLQRIRFKRLANNANNIIQNHTSRFRSINNADTLRRIARINTPQITNIPFERDFFGGTNFYDNNNPDYLIYPIGSLGYSSF